MLNHLDMHDHLIPRNLYMKNEIDIGGVAHQAGTCRFGRDPKTSVLDTNCKAHELDNLYVVASWMPPLSEHVDLRGPQCWRALRRAEDRSVRMLGRIGLNRDEADHLPITSHGGEQQTGAGPFRRDKDHRRAESPGGAVDEERSFPAEPAGSVR